MAMPFSSRFDVFQVVQETVGQSVQLSCIRADDMKGSGYDFWGKVQVAIQRSELNSVIVDISEPNQNVLYELM